MDRRKTNEDRRADVRNALAHYTALAARAALLNATTIDEVRDAIRRVQICPDQVEGLLNTISGSLVGGCEPLSELIDNTADAAGELVVAWEEEHADEWAEAAHEERKCDERREQEAA